MNSDKKPSERWPDLFEEFTKSLGLKLKYICPYCYKDKGDESNNGCCKEIHCTWYWIDDENENAYEVEFEVEPAFKAWIANESDRLAEDREARLQEHAEHQLDAFLEGEDE